MFYSLLCVSLSFFLLSFICSFHCVFTGIDFFWFHLRPFAWGNCLAVYNTCHDIKKYMRTIAAYYKMLSGFESSGVAEHCIITFIWTWNKNAHSDSILRFSKVNCSVAESSSSNLLLFVTIYIFFQAVLTLPLLEHNRNNTWGQRRDRNMISLS